LAATNPGNKRAQTAPCGALQPPPIGPPKAAAAAGTSRRLPGPKTIRPVVVKSKALIVLPVGVGRNRVFVLDVKGDGDDQDIDLLPECTGPIYATNSLGATGGGNKRGFG